MSYKVEFSKNALKCIKKLDKQTASLIIGWIEKNLQNCSNPFIHGKALVGNLAGTWRYRVGDYRILCKIENDKLVILVLEIGHRKEIYAK